MDVETGRTLFIPSANAHKKALTATVTPGGQLGCPKRLKRTNIPDEFLIITSVLPVLAVTRSFPARNHETKAPAFHG